MCLAKVDKWWKLRKGRFVRSRFLFILGPCVPELALRGDEAADPGGHDRRPPPPQEAPPRRGRPRTRECAHLKAVEKGMKRFVEFAAENGELSSGAGGVDEAIRSERAGPDEPGGQETVRAQGSRHERRSRRGEVKTKRLKMHEFFSVSQRIIRLQSRAEETLDDATDRQQGLRPPPRAGRGQGQQGLCPQTGKLISYNILFLVFSY